MAYDSGPSPGGFGFPFGPGIGNTTNLPYGYPFDTRDPGAYPAGGPPPPIAPAPPAPPAPPEVNPTVQPLPQHRPDPTPTPTPTPAPTPAPTPTPTPGGDVFAPGSDYDDFDAGSADDHIDDDQPIWAPPEVRGSIGGGPDRIIFGEGDAPALPPWGPLQQIIVPVPVPVPRRSPRRTAPVDPFRRRRRPGRERKPPPPAPPPLPQTPDEPRRTRPRVPDPFQFPQFPHDPIRPQRPTLPRPQPPPAGEVPGRRLTVPKPVIRPIAVPSSPPMPPAPTPPGPVSPPNFPEPGEQPSKSPSPSPSKPRPAPGSSTSPARWPLWPILGDVLRVFLPSPSPVPFTAPSSLTNPLTGPERNPVTPLPARRPTPTVPSPPDSPGQEPLTPIEPGQLSLPESMTAPSDDPCKACAEQRRRRRKPERKCRARAAVVWASGPRKGQPAGTRCISWEKS
jgi:hypothetical protein